VAVGVWANNAHTGIDVGTGVFASQPGGGQVGSSSLINLFIAGQQNEVGSIAGGVADTDDVVANARAGVGANGAILNAHGERGAKALWSHDRGGLADFRSGASFFVCFRLKHQECGYVLGGSSEVAEHNPLTSIDVHKGAARFAGRGVSTTSEGGILQPLGDFRDLAGGELEQERSEIADLCAFRQAHEVERSRRFGGVLNVEYVPARL